MTSPIIQFYRGAGPDSSGRLLADIQGWDDGRLEHVHDYIQWLFPLPEASAFNPHAPLLGDADVAAFRSEAALRAALLVSLSRMRGFYGLAGDPARRTAWLTPGNHNMLRLTRILRSLHLLGLEEDAATLLRDLEALYQAGAGGVIGPVTRAYWRRAVA